MPLGPGLIGIVTSILFFFIALIFFDAISVNVIDCTTLSDAGSQNMTKNCENGKTYAGIAFTIAPIVILLDVFGIFPFFGGRLSVR